MVNFNFTKMNQKNIELADRPVEFGVGGLFLGWSVVHQEVIQRLLDGKERPVKAQVWSLTQFYSVDFSKSRIGVKKCVFT